MAIRVFMVTKRNAQTTSYLDQTLPFCIFYKSKSRKISRDLVFLNPHAGLVNADFWLKMRSKQQ